MSNLLTDVFFATEEAEKLRIVDGISLSRLRELAEAEREGKIKIGSDWTPCADGLPLPKDGEPCYITVLKTEEDGRKHLYVVEGYFCSDKGIWFDRGGWKVNSKGVYPWSAEAIAWKLNVAPEPYNPDHIGDANKKVED